MNIQPNVSLLALNTLAVPSRAQYLAQVESLDELKEAAAFASQSNLEMKVLGGGSNVVLPEYVSGLVLRYMSTEYQVINEDDEHVVLRVGAGFNWHDLVMKTLSEGFFGLQNLAFIPGLVGAAPVQNIGAYGVEVKEFIQTVHGVIFEDGEVFALKNEECHFDYRESIFKHELNNRALITAVDFRLNKQPNINVDYAPLDKMAQERGVPSPLELAHWVIDVRSSKLPIPSELPNAGSFFKNPIIDESVFADLIKRYPSMPHYHQSVGVKVPAGWLIDQMGFKGKTFGPVSVHKKQALVLVNKGGTGKDVLAASEQIKLAVYNQYGIELEQEPRVFT